MSDDFAHRLEARLVPEELRNRRHLRLMRPGGSSTRIHLVPLDGTAPGGTAYRAICGANPRRGFYPVTPIGYEVNPDALCPRCVKAKRPTDITDQPGGTL